MTVMLFILYFAILLFQNNLLRYYYEKLCRGQYITQVPYDRQVYNEDAVE